MVPGRPDTCFHMSGRPLGIEFSAHRAFYMHSGCFFYRLLVLPVACSLGCLLYRLSNGVTETQTQTLTLTQTQTQKTHQGEGTRRKPSRKGNQQNRLTQTRFPFPRLDRFQSLSYVFSRVSASQGDPGRLRSMCFYVSKSPGARPRGPKCQQV